MMQCHISYSLHKEYKKSDRFIDNHVTKNCIYKGMEYKKEAEMSVACVVFGGGRFVHVLFFHFPEPLFKFVGSERLAGCTASTL